MTTYARIKEIDGKTFLVDRDGNVLGQVGPECPFPCGWRNLLTIHVKECAYLALNLHEGEPVTEANREAVMRAMLRGKEVIQAMLSAATVDVSAAIVTPDEIALKGME